ncbi:hypothetical protein KNU10_gp12 [Gordonia phage Foxboro]|uniref:Uncharacterized protein n=1 Tax=Gordonia phage Foxboro TaxID=2301602 RepID=A0A385UGY0_9CAUD|nr:hypothetical protein KNU10_gp12 [Gordonia phage Foxboro]AYB69144.1 hypothetical protein SEA_FOXBORO_12 [Gordonia phage Foxboro]
MNNYPVVTTVEELNALPEGTVIRAEEIREKDHLHGRPWTIGTYLEKSRRNEWLELNPSDRMDGEETVDPEFVIRYRARNGRCLILWKPGELPWELGGQ